MAKAKSRCNMYIKLIISLLSMRLATVDGGIYFSKIDYGSTEKTLFGALPCKLVKVWSTPYYLMYCLWSTNYDPDIIMVGFNGSHCAQCFFSIDGSPSGTVSTFNADLFLKQGPRDGSIKTTYGTYDIITRAATWEFAQKYCELSGGYLATIETQAEFNAIQLQTGPHWFGLNDRETEGAYVWAHNNQPLGSYHPWGSGEPHQTDADNEDCVIISETGKWGDVKCGSSASFICEYP